MNRNYIFCLCSVMDPRAAQQDEMTREYKNNGIIESATGMVRRKEGVGRMQII